jgi:thiamine biosynthesis lipoprotein
MKRLQQRRTALGSQALITLVVSEEHEAITLFKNLWQMVKEFEYRFSRFRKTSELSKLNAQAGQEVQVSREFLELLESSLAFSRSTDGLFNPLILPALQQAGYIGSWPEPDKFDAEQDYRSRQSVVDISEVIVIEELVVLPEGSALDFGGIGKGYLLDQLSLHLLDNGCPNFWLSLGGDITCSGRDLHDEAWSIGVQDAHDDQNLIANISNDDGNVLAIATSGVTKRKGANWHHIIDPRTGIPAMTDVLAATVTSDQAVMADIYAKCLVLLNETESEDFISQHKISQVYIQRKKST